MLMMQRSSVIELVFRLLQVSRRGWLRFASLLMLLASAVCDIVPAAYRTKPPSTCHDDGLCEGLNHK